MNDLKELYKKHGIEPTTYFHHENKSKEIGNSELARLLKQCNFKPLAGTLESDFGSLISNLGALEKNPNSLKYATINLYGRDGFTTEDFQKMEKELSITKRNVSPILEDGEVVGFQGDIHFSMCLRDDGNTEVSMLEISHVWVKSKPEVHQIPEPVPIPDPVQESEPVLMSEPIESKPNLLRKLIGFISYFCMMISYLLNATKFTFISIARAIIHRTFNLVMMFFVILVLTYGILYYLKICWCDLLDALINICGQSEEI